MKAIRWSGAVAVAALTWSCSASPQVGDAEAMFRGGPAHPGVYAGGDVSGLAGVLWHFETRGAVRSSPTVAGGTLFVGSSDGFLYALDAVSGRERWRYDASSPVSSTPAMADGLVFVTDRAGVLHAVRAGDGTPAWRVRTGAERPLPWGEEGWDYYTSSPTVVAGLVVVGAGDGRLRAVDARDGTLQWSYDVEGRIRSSPAVADGVVFVGGTDGSLHAVALATGEALWRHDTEGRSLESADFGFDRRSIQSSPVVGDGAVFFGSRDGHVYAVDAASGELRWRFDQEVSWCNTSPALMDGTVYAGTSDGLFVHALDARSGRELWRTPTRGRVFASPSLSGETLVVGDHSGTLWALDRFTGEARWSFRTRGAVQSSAVVHDSTVFVGSDDGFVYALRGTGGPSTRRAVFWDEAYPSLYQGHEALREAMESSGYPVLDADALAVFMAERVRDGLPSAVIFARDRVPEAVAATPSDTTLFRRYLEAGGRVVWLGLPPLSLLLDPETGQPVGLDLGRAGALLGVDHAGATMDEYTATATDVGLAWGLPGWWTDQLGVEPAEVITALALDERGRATSWVRRYGNGGAFVKLWGRLDAIPDADPVRHAAEHILR